MWAGKEAAYKIISKDDPVVSSTPRRYEVSLFRNRKSDGETGHSRANTRVDGFVETPNGRVHIRVFMDHDCIHCIGTADSPETMDSVVWSADEISRNHDAAPDHESVFVRDALKRHLSVLCNTTPEDIEIRRGKTPRGLGCPIAYINGDQSEFDISLSHDGRFAAYAFAPKNIRH